jgi:hypothetical protein
MTMYQDPDRNILRFGSVAEFARFVKDGDHMHGSESSSFYGDLSGKETVRRLLRGDEANVPAAEKLLDEIGGDIGSSAALWEHEVAGAIPDVPAAISGDPECMWDLQSQTDTTAPLSIIVDLTSSAAFSQESMRRRGIAILALVMKLAATRPVTLELCTLMHGKARDGEGDERYSYIGVTVNTTPLDLATAAHAITYVGVARRMFYGVAEALHGFNGTWPRLRDDQQWWGEPRGDSSKAAITRVLRRKLDLSEEVLYVPAAFLHDELMTNPKAWVEKAVALHTARPE